MRDLKNWKGCPAPKGVALEGRFVKLEPYERDRHLQDLWDGLGGMAINPLLRYFTQPDFKDIEGFDAWLTAAQEKSGWVTEVFRDKATGIVVGMANYMRADPANGVVEVGYAVPLVFLQERWPLARSEMTGVKQVRMNVVNLLGEEPVDAPMQKRFVTSI